MCFKNFKFFIAVMLALSFLFIGMAGNVQPIEKPGIIMDAAYSDVVFIPVFDQTKYYVKAQYVSEEVSFIDSLFVDHNKSTINNYYIKKSNNKTYYTTFVSDNKIINDYLKSKGKVTRFSECLSPSVNKKIII